MQTILRLIVAAVVLLPLALAAMSPLLAWRQPIYIVAGFAGIAALGLLFIQPLLISGILNLGHPMRDRQLHRAIGSGLILIIVIHVVGLWITSPPDVIDALLYRSPTPFSFWGVSAMWLLFAAGALVAFRRRIQLRPKTWSLIHRLLVTAAVCGTIVHTLTITGTMETYSKWLLCTGAFCAMVHGVWRKRT